MSPKKGAGGVKGGEGGGEESEGGGICQMERGGGSQGGRRWSRGGKGSAHSLILVMATASAIGE